MDKIPKTHWRKWLHIVFVKCPGCGIEAKLDHDVADDGKVSPSLDCPSCDFHTYVVLEGWPGKEKGGGEPPES